jgi:serine/threonine-protein kinase
MSTTELNPHTKLGDGRYEIVETIGAGGMGCIYRAIDHLEKRTIALKQSLFSSDTEDFDKKRELFGQEAALLTLLDHPGLPKVSDYFLEGTGQYLVMDLVEGPDLARVLETGFIFTADMTLEIASQLLQIIDYLHSREPQIFHRDVKPQNVKLSKSGQIILLDFGVAKDAGKGTILRGHSANYSPPEQFQGLTTDARGDLYAVGATLYHLVTGQKPADSIRERSRAIERGEQDPLVPLRNLNPYVPHGVAEIIHRSMALRAEDRPAGAREMLYELNHEWSKAMFENTIITSKLAATLPDGRAKAPEPEVKRTPKINADRIYKFWEGSAMVTYSPPSLVSPTSISLESLTIAFREQTTHTIVITDMNHDPVSGSGQVYVQETHRGEFYGKAISVDLDWLPDTFRLHIMKESQEGWESVDIIRQTEIVRAD